MRILCLIFSLFFFSIQSNAQRIKERKISKNTYEYSAPNCPWINYTWSLDKGKITKNQNYKIRVYSTTTPNKISVTETPIFPKKTIYVKDFGAKGDGITDDTKAIQIASNTLYKLGGGTLVFDKNKTYIVRSVIIKERIHYKGNNTTLKRPALQAKWTRTFRTDYKRTFKEESKPLKISGFTFDGNRKNQGPYKKYQLQQAHQIFLSAGLKSKTQTDTGRLKAFIEDCHFRDNVADGISQNVNVDLTVRNCDARNVFRGGYVCTGGNSIAKLYNFSTLKGDIKSGIDVEVDSRGYLNNMRVNILFDNLNVYDGDFDIRVLDKSKVVIQNSKILNPPLAIYAPKSTLIFDNCIVTGGTSNKASSGSGAFTLPYKIYFNKCDIILKKEKRSTIGGAIFIRNLVSGNSLPSANVYLKSVNFRTSGFENSVERRLPIIFYNDKSTKNKLNIFVDNVDIDKDFTAPFGTIRYQKGTPFHKYSVNINDKKNAGFVNRTIELPPNFLVNFGVYQE